MKKSIIPIIFLLLCVVFLREYVVKQEVIEYGNTSVTKEKSTGIQIIFLDIGQGDATFIIFPDGRQMLVDCSLDGRIGEALGKYMPFHDKTIDYLVITHPDLDHYGGCIDVLRQFEVAHILYNGSEKQGSDYFRVFTQHVEAEEAEYTIIDSVVSWEIASTTLRFLYPDHNIQYNPKIPGIEKEVSTNNTSLVFLLDYGQKSMLFPGDAEHELESYLITQYGKELDVDILKASHHGAAGSSIIPFVKITSPVHTIFSAGRSNRYNHPSRRIIKRFERNGSKTWRTDTQGDILIHITPLGKIYVTSEKGIPT
ncbi:MAG: hypothetical protein CL685_02235 [Candidatus Magasanikbacteria bacterium]|nr:hypothetical protein [Candidatus Magasanikbacteria bacterium]